MTTMLGATGSTQAAHAQRTRSTALLTKRRLSGYAAAIQPVSIPAKKHLDQAIQIGNLEFWEYFVWAESEKAALRKLATLNKAVQSYIPKAVAAEEI